MTNNKNKKREISLNLIKNIKLHDAGVKRKSFHDTPSCSSSVDRINYPSLYLNVKQAPGLENHEVEESVTLVIEGKIVSHSKNERRGEDGKETFDIEIRKIGVSPKKKEKEDE